MNRREAGFCREQRAGVGKMIDVAVDANGVSGSGDGVTDMSTP